MVRLGDLMDLKGNSLDCELGIDVNYGNWTYWRKRSASIRWIVFGLALTCILHSTGSI